MTKPILIRLRWLLDLSKLSKPKESTSRQTTRQNNQFSLFWSPILQWILQSRILLTYLAAEERNHGHNKRQPLQKLSFSATAMGKTMNSPSLNSSFCLFFTLLLRILPFSKELFLTFCIFLWILGLTCCGGGIRNREIFNSKLDSYETKTIFIGRHRLHLRGGGGYDAQAQLILDVYPSQDTPTNSIWIFSGSSSVATPGTLRTSGNHSSADGWQTASKIYQNNLPSNAQITLSPLFSSTNTTDMESIRKRIPGGARTQTFAANATNTPTITIGTTPVNRTINRMFFNNQPAADMIGIRVSSSFNYGSYSGQASSWTGAGLLINKPIGDFLIKNVGAWATLEPNFAGSGVTMRIHSAVIPEPEEYALVFGLFALAFVFFHRRRMQKKQRRQAAAL